jgi:hypothetical protein
MVQRYLGARILDIQTQNFRSGTVYAHVKHTYLLGMAAIESFDKSIGI